MNEQELKDELLEIKALLYTHVIPNDGLARISKVCEIVDMPKSSIYELQAKGDFPHSINAGGNRARWRLSEVYLWIMNRDKVA